MLLPAALTVKRESLRHQSATESRLTIAAASPKITTSNFCKDSVFYSTATAEILMYIHMFAFRFKNGVTGDQKNNCVTEIRKLKDEIKEVQESWVGLNISPRGQGYELGGSMKFADAAAFEGYNSHPVHQKLLSWLVPLIEPIEVDFSL
jgi:hypothetical protein